MGEKLDAGTRFPNLRLELSDGRQVTLPDSIATDYAVVLLYRGHW